MEKRSVNRVAYLIIFCAGMILFVLDPTVTGAAAGTKAAVTFSSIGIACVIIGFIIVYMTEREEPEIEQQDTLMEPAIPEPSEERVIDERKIPTVRHSHRRTKLPRTPARSSHTKKRH